MERNPFLIIKFQLIKVKGIIKLENNHFAAITEIKNSDKKHQYVLKERHEWYLDKNGFYLHCLKASSYKRIINYSRKKSNFTLEKPEDTSLFKWSKLTSTVMEQINIMCHLMDIESRAQYYSVVSCQKWVI